MSTSRYADCLLRPERPMTAAEDDYRRGFRDGELGRPEARGSHSYAAGWHIGATFARDPDPAAAPPEPTEPAARTVDVNDLLAELPRNVRRP